MLAQGSLFRRFAATAARRPASWSEPKFLAVPAASACPPERRRRFASWLEQRRRCRRAFGNTPQHLQPHVPWDQAPKAWEPGSSAATPYTADDVAEWRADFGFARRQHSLAEIGYTDDELLEWRKPFDELATDAGIGFKAFETFVARKYRSFIPEDELMKKVHFFWETFDRDGNSVIDFGEFIGSGLLFDVIWAKKMIRQEGIENAFRRYSVHGFMAEAQMFELMCEFRFFVATATDVHKLMRVADRDGDGLVSLSDFVQWASDEELSAGLLGEDREVEGSPQPKERKPRIKRPSPRPPAEPED